MKGKQNLEEYSSFFLEQHLNKDVEAYVAEDKEKIIAVTYTVFFDLPPNDMLLYGKMGLPVNNYTLPAYRGEGIGQKLFVFACEMEQKKGVEMLEMQIPEMYVELYSKLGFALNEKVPMQFRILEK